MDEDSGLIGLDLSDLVLLPVNRIAIIQDVERNWSNEGFAAYRVTSDCGGVRSLPPVARSSGSVGSGIFVRPGGETVVSLSNGRFTVHKPGFANFGPAAAYPAVATSSFSSEIRGCSVTATIDLRAPGCTLDGPSTRTLAWTSANPLVSFDFEFKIHCDRAPLPEPEGPPLPQPTGAPSTGAPSTGAPSTGASAGTPGGDSSNTAVVGSPNVRIVARLLDNGRVEFGLQQQVRSSWSDWILPRARLFPVAAPVGSRLVSSPVTLSVSESASALVSDITVRLVARKRDDGRVEFGLQQQEDGSWSDRMPPWRRLFPLTTAVGRWLGSSTLTLGI